MWSGSIEPDGKFGGTKNRAFSENQDGSVMMSKFQETGLIKILTHIVGCKK